MIELKTKDVHPRKCRIELPISKSILNRELILAALCGKDLPDFLSTWPDDCKILHQGIQDKGTTINLGAAGTAMRFMTAYSSTVRDAITLTGSERMKERPIGALVTALEHLGADIEYLETEGFPPLRVTGPARGGTTEISGSQSSQFISALLLVGAAFPHGLDLHIQSPVTSRPYIDLTLNLLAKWGIVVENKSEGVLAIAPQPFVAPSKNQVESDWSAAAFFYGLMAQGVADKMLLLGLNCDSVQGDAKCIELFAPLGVQTESHDEGVLLIREGEITEDYLANLNDNPDLAQAIAFTCSALGIKCTLRGLHTLCIKETDRLQAMKECLVTLGCEVYVDEDSIAFDAAQIKATDRAFASYEDHRMAMGLSILTPALGNILIDDEHVVSKSFPGFWNQLKSIGCFSLSKL